MLEHSGHAATATTARSRRPARASISRRRRPRNRRSNSSTDYTDFTDFGLSGELRARAARRRWRCALTSGPRSGPARGEDAAADRESHLIVGLSRSAAASPPLAAFGGCQSAPTAVCVNLRNRRISTVTRPNAPVNDANRRGNCRVGVFHCYNRSWVAAGASRPSPQTRKPTWPTSTTSS